MFVQNVFMKVVQGGLCHDSRAEKLTNHGYLNFALKLLVSLKSRFTVNEMI